MSASASSTSNGSVRRPDGQRRVRGGGSRGRPVWPRHQGQRPHHYPSSSSSYSDSGSSSYTGSSSYSSDSREYHRRLKIISKANPENVGHPRKFYKKHDWLESLRDVRTTRQIEYVTLGEMSGHEFRKRYEHGDRPCMIRGATKGWKAMRKWSRKNLVKNYGDSYFQVSGKPMLLRHYMRYCKHTRDDSPLYLFQDALERSGRQGMIKDYTVPSVFKYDLLGVLPNDMRPPYRWIVIGPKRSGTEIHQDPLGTSAWNTLTEGYKLWVMFPAHIPKKRFMMKSKFKTKRTEAIDWFRDCFPSCLKHQDELEMIVCVQGPGETIFVPGDWWHGVLNLSFTVAITQNFTSKENCRRVYARTKKERARLSKRWFKVLAYTEPDVALKLAEFEEQRSLSTGSRWSGSRSGWSEVDELTTLSSDEIGKYDLAVDRETSLSTPSSSYHDI